MLGRGGGGGGGGGGLWSVCVCGGGGGDIVPAQSLKRFSFVSYRCKPHVGCFNRTSRINPTGT